MRMMTRHVLFQLFSVFVVTLGVMTLLAIMLLIVLQAHDLGAMQIAQLIPFILPEALQFTVPACALFAVSLVYGRMSSANEVVALKALGISPWAIIGPMLVAVTLLSLASVWLNDVAASWGRNGVKRVIIESIEEIAYGHLRSEKSYSSKRFSITVKRVDGRRLIEPLLTFQADADTPSTVIRSAWAELHADPAGDTLTILMHNGSATRAGFHFDFPGTKKSVLPLSDGKKSQIWTPTEMALFEIPHAITVQKQRIEDLRQQLASRAAFEMLTGDLEELAPAQWTDAQDLLTFQDRQLHRLEAEPCRRWAGGFSCLCFVMIGAPLAIRMRNQDFLTSFFACFLPILLVYYPFFQYSLDRAKVGAMPPYSIWLANVLLLIWGAWLMRRVVRY